MDIRDRVALVTGAGYGIGRAIARRLADEGAHIVVNDIDDEHGTETVSMIEAAGGKAAYVHADVASEDAASPRRRSAGSTSWSTMPRTRSSPRSSPPPLRTAGGGPWMSASSAS